MPKGRSLLLELPAEIRNSIYEEVAADSQALISRRHRGTLLSKSGLGRLSRQVRSEYHAALYLYAPKITARVKNSDFGHVVTFLNRLSDAEMRALPSVQVASNRRVTLELELGSDRVDYDLLRRWLRRCGHPTKRGTNIGFSYDDPKRTYRCQLAVLRYLDNLMMKSGDARMKEETRKMIDALRG